MNRVVCIVSHADQVLGVEDVGIELSLEVLRPNRVHVMNENLVVDIVTWDPEVACVVSKDDLLPCLAPLGGVVEGLVQVPFETEGLIARILIETQVFVPILEGFDAREFTVGPNPDSRPTPPPA